MSDPAHGPRGRPSLWVRNGGRLILGGVGAAVIAGGEWLGSRQRLSPPPARVAGFLATEAMAVGPGVYLLGKSSPVAVYLVETSDGLGLIDSGLEANAAGVCAQLAELR